jgi:hypothetical protein
MIDYQYLNIDSAIILESILLKLSLTLRRKKVIINM